MPHAGPLVPIPPGKTAPPLPDCGPGAVFSAGQLQDQKIGTDTAQANGDECRSGRLGRFDARQQIVEIPGGTQLLVELQPVQATRRDRENGWRCSRCRVSTPTWLKFTMRDFAMTARPIRGLSASQTTPPARAC